MPSGSDNYIPEAVDASKIKPVGIRTMSKKEIELESNDEKLRDIRLVAEKHWEYTRLIIEKLLKILDVEATDSDRNDILDFCRTLYIEPFVHGYKHRLAEEGIIK